MPKPPLRKAFENYSFIGRSNSIQALTTALETLSKPVSDERIKAERLRETLSLMDEGVAQAILFGVSKRWGLSPVNGSDNWHDFFQVLMALREIQTAYSEAGYKMRYEDGHVSYEFDPALIRDHLQTVVPNLRSSLKDIKLGVLSAAKEEAARRQDSASPDPS